MEIISVIGMVLGVAVLIYLTFKGVNGFVASLVGSVIVIVSSGLPFWGTLTRIALSIDGIIVLHVAGGEGGAVPLPHAQGAGPEKDIRLLGELHPQGGVCDLPPEGGHPFTVLLVHLGGAERTFHAATPRFSVSVIISESDRPRKEAVQLT